MSTSSTNAIELKRMNLLIFDAAAYFLVFSFYLLLSKGAKD